MKSGLSFWGYPVSYKYGFYFLYLFFLRAVYRRCCSPFRRLAGKGGRPDGFFRIRRP